MRFRRNDVKEIIEIGISLSTEKDRNRLLEKILNESMKITNADAGTVYVLENNKLHFKIMKTLSMGVSRGCNGDVIDLPPVPLSEENVCAYSALHKKLVNIEDVHHNDMFDFSGPKKYDKITGYQTTSMLVIPLVNYEDEVIGVIQLINSMKNRKIACFDEEGAYIVKSLASQAAVAISNMKYTEELKEQLWSFTKALAVAIDERTPYNARHTEKVADYVSKMADYIEIGHRLGKYDIGFDQQRKEQIVMAAWLHDVGKMTVPLEVMNKEDRLGKYFEPLKHRFEIFKCYMQINYLQNRLSEEEYEKQKKELDECLSFVMRINKSGFLSDDDAQYMKAVKNKSCLSPDGETIPFFAKEELDCLEIKKGTLNEEERKIMEGHAKMTKKFLEKVHFNRYFKDCATWASNHHERLDGTGYPNRLKGDDLSTEARMIAVADVFDALTSADRPYKKPIPVPKAFDILEDMAADGAIDKQIVDVLRKCVE